MPRDAFVPDSLALDGDWVCFRFRFNQSLIDDIRKIKGRVWDVENQVWRVPKVEVVRALHLADVYDLIVPDVLEKYRPVDDFDFSKKILESKFFIDALSKIEGFDPYQDMMPYQKAGIDYLLEKKTAFLCDDPGLGKTVQALRAIAKAALIPALIICPAALKTNWRNEIKKWLSPDIAGYTFTFDPLTKPRKIPKALIYIINYDLLRKHDDWLLNKRFDVIVFDESHRIKEPERSRTQKALKITAKNREYVWCLTGTPILSRPLELVPQIAVMNRFHHFQNDWNFFKNRYCDPQLVVRRHRRNGNFENKKFYTYKGATNQAELRQVLEYFMLRRLKVDVLKDLPPKQRILQFLPVTSQAYEKYVLLEKQIREEVEELGKVHDGKYNARHVMIFSKLQQAAVNCKFEALCSWIEDFLQSGKKLFVLAHHVQVVSALLGKFEEYNPVKIVGGMRSPDRDRSVELFQNDPNTQLLIGNIEAAGEGLTLTAASDVLFAQLPMTPGKLNQAEDRIHRITQTKQVTCWALIAEGTVEEKIYNILIKKRDMISGVSEQSEVSTVMEELMWEF